MSLRALGLACCFLTAASCAAQAEDNKLFPAEAAIPNSRIVRFTSAIDKEPYTLQVSIPIFAPRPKAGYPVIYVLDGELYFPGAVIAADFLADKAPGDRAAVVVGIGHDALNDKSLVARNASPADGEPGMAALKVFQRLRDHDFKWPAKHEPNAPALVDMTIGSETGDVDAFLEVIEKEIKPRIEALVPVDKRNQALFGHSLGGLAVMRALFTEPDAFHTFIAASPTLFYDSATLLADERHFAAEVTRKHIAPRVLVTVGALEPDFLAPTKQMVAKFTPEQRTEFATYGKTLDIWPGMITRARALAGQLKALDGKPGYEVAFALIPDQDHQHSVYPATIRALQFAFLNH